MTLLMGGVSDSHQASNGGGRRADSSELRHIGTMEENTGSKLSRPASTIAADRATIHLVKVTNENAERTFRAADGAGLEVNVDEANE